MCISFLKHWCWTHAGTHAVGWWYDDGSLVPPCETVGGRWVLEYVAMLRFQAGVINLLCKFLTRARWICANLFFCCCCCYRARFASVYNAQASNININPLDFLVFNFSLKRRHHKMHAMCDVSVLVLLVCVLHIHIYMTDEGWRYKVISVRCGIWDVRTSYICAQTRETCSMLERHSKRQIDKIVLRQRGVCCVSPNWCARKLVAGREPRIKKIYIYSSLTYH